MGSSRILSKKDDRVVDVRNWVFRVTKAAVLYTGAKLFKHWSMEGSIENSPKHLEGDAAYL